MEKHKKDKAERDEADRIRREKLRKKREEEEAGGKNESSRIVEVTDEEAEKIKQEDAQAKVRTNSSEKIKLFFLLGSEINFGRKTFSCQRE